MLFEALSVVAVGGVVALTLYMMSKSTTPRALSDTERLTAVQNEIIDRLRSEIKDMKQETADMRVWVSELVNQLIEKGIAPVTLESIKNSREQAADRLLSYPAEMRRQLVEQFSIDEMKSLAFDLNMSTELPDSLDGASRRLIEQARKANKVKDLANQILVLRPNKH